MIIRFLFFLVLALALFFWARRYLQTAPAGQQRSRKITLGIIAFAVLMALLALTGRMHWLAAVGAALLPLIKILIQPLTAALLQRFNPNQTQDHSNQDYSAGSDNQSLPIQTAGVMEKEEARQILGLDKSYSKDDIVQAHRNLMLKIHPDRGGNDYLAAQLNKAKETLLAFL